MKHGGIKNDEFIKQENVKRGNPLCEECDGTGNMFYSMYKRCNQCLGDGVKILEPIK